MFRAEDGSFTDGMNICRIPTIGNAEPCEAASVTRSSLAPRGICLCLRRGYKVKDMMSLNPYCSD